MNKVKLSAAQQNLLDAMRSGVRVHFVNGLDAHCFRNDTMKCCTATVSALMRMKLVEEFESDWRGCRYRPVETEKTV